MTPENFSTQHIEMPPYKKLSALVGVLTGPQGCDWDKRQTAESIINYVIDEAHELKSALAEGDPAEVKNELGDLLFTVEFLVHSLQDKATIEGATEVVVEKMIRRHPHVFAGETFTDEELKRNWEAEKLNEMTKRERYDDDLPTSLPELEKAWKVLGRVMNSGFRYPTGEDALGKVWEEMFELERALLSDSKDSLDEELGDLLLSIITVAKMEGRHPGTCLAQATKKLCDRLDRLEERAGKPLVSLSSEEIAKEYEAVHEDRPLFFGYCSVGTWPSPVQKAVRRAADLVGRRGFSGALTLIEERDHARSRIAKFCGANDQSKVVYVPNVSTAALGIAYCGPWKRGDKILLGQHEFPANTIPWLNAADTLGLEVVWFDEDSLRRDGQAGWEALDEFLKKENPALVALSAVSFWSGYRVPLDRLASVCHQNGARVYVDGIQALGSTPIEMGEIDYLAGGSHKTLLSPEGAGFLIVAEEACPHWTPRISSWLSLPEPFCFLERSQPAPMPNNRAPRANDPSTLESGSLNSLGYAGLIAAIDYLSELDVTEIFAKIQSLHDPLEKAFVDRGWTSLRALHENERSSVLSFEAPHGVDVLEVKALLGDAGVEVTAPNGRLRFGFHVFNELYEVEQTIELLDETLNRKSPA